MLKSLAALVLVTATNSFSSIFPVDCREKKWQKSCTFILHKVAAIPLKYKLYSSLEFTFIQYNTTPSNLRALIQIWKRYIWWNMSKCSCLTQSYHSSIPHHRHPLLNSVGSLWDQSEVIFTDCFLSCGEAGMSAGRHLEVSTGWKKTHTHAEI